MDLPILPPLPPPIEIANGMYYGIILDPYVRKIIHGPVVIRTNNGRQYWESTADGSTGLLDSNLVIEWTDDTHVGSFDPNYPPISVPGKFHPGTRVVDNLSSYRGTILGGPYLSVDWNQTPSIVYICRWQNNIVEIALERSIHENPENYKNRMKYSRKLVAKANRLPILKNIITEKLGTITLPVNAAQRKTRNITLPVNVAAQIAEFAYGRVSNANILRANAARYGTENPPKPHGALSGGRRRRTRRRRR